MELQSFMQDFDDRFQAESGWNYKVSCRILMTASKQSQDGTVPS
jgi:hypothetical protein